MEHVACASPELVFYSGPLFCRPARLLLLVLDAFVPGVNFRQEESWIPANSRAFAYYCGHVLVGWIVTALLIAAVFGLYVMFLINREREAAKAAAQPAKPAAAAKSKPAPATVSES